MYKFTEKEFHVRRRESLLGYDIYQFNFDEMIEGIQIVGEAAAANISTEGKSLYRRSISLNQRAEDSLTFLLNGYSGGHDIQDLAAIYPAVFEYWKDYALSWKKYQESDESSNKTVAAIPLLDITFVFANQLVCLAILFGWGNLMREIPSIIDYNNPKRDGLLERLLVYYIATRGVAPNECLRHLPYFKTLKIFQAAKESRAGLMKEYLDDWYKASRRERYYESHKRGDVFTGYWSWEAAAITYVLDIDDSSYRNASFYPADLVDFARSINAPRSNQPMLEDQDLRVKSGQACPKSGIWVTLDIPIQQRRFTVGETMQAADASYGITVWRYIGD